MSRTGKSVVLVFLVMVLCQSTPSADACCGVSRAGRHVVNADQTVILIWDPVTKTEHFIRKASFKTDDKDFGFIIPTPSKPESGEAGDEAFAFLAKITEPVVRHVSGGGCGCSMSKKAMVAAPAVRVLEEKDVAGYRLAVLQTENATELVKWLKENGYPYSTATEAWAKPYVKAGWMMTALRVAPEKAGEVKKDVAASALRLCFKTDRPLFPYREPESAEAATALGAQQRLLRFYFLSDARYQGELTREQAWTGQVAWAGKLSAAQRETVLRHLKLDEAAGPAEFWLTEFEDPWPYRQAPADLYFARSTDQSTLQRPAVTAYHDAGPDVTLLAFGGLVVVPWVCRRRHRRHEALLHW